MQSVASLKPSLPVRSRVVSFAQHKQEGPFGLKPAAIALAASLLLSASPFMDDAAFAA